jgi:hypothetical protein
MSEKEFVTGLFVKPPHERAPDFVKCSISIKRADLGNWLRQKDDEWINLDVKESQNGKWYAEVSTWKPEKKEQKVDDFNDELPPF